MKFSLLILFALVSCGKNHFITIDSLVPPKNAPFNTPVDPTGGSIHDEIHEGETVTGSAAAGATTGETTSGGATSGGATSGGATSGGATSGGATSGGATSGGATTGGATTGGATTGGGSTNGEAVTGSATAGATTGETTSGGATTGGTTTTCEEKIELHADINSDGSSDEYIGDVKCFDGSISAIENYNYSNGSSHVVHGPKELPHQSRFFCYKNSTGTYFFMSHHKDHTGGQPHEYGVIWQVGTSNNNLLDQIVIADESNELIQASTSEMTKNYVGDWIYNRETDGGVIGPFTTKHFKVKLEVLYAEKINHLRIVSADAKKELKNKFEESTYIFESKSVCK